MLFQRQVIISFFFNIFLYQKVIVSSDRSVPRDYASVFLDIILLGNKIRNRQVSWNNTFMSEAFRSERMREAKRLLLSLKEAFDTIKPTL